jgi:hypothetical protein
VIISYRGLEVEGTTVPGDPGVRYLPGGGGIEPTGPECDCYEIVGVDDPDELFSHLAEAFDTAALTTLRGFLVLTGRLPSCAVEWIERMWDEGIRSTFESIEEEDPYHDE